MEKFRLIIYSRDYDLGTHIVVQNNTSLMEIYKGFLTKLKISIPNKKEPIFETNGKWVYALGNKLEDLGEFSDEDLIILSLVEKEF